MKNIVAAYNETKSIKATAKLLGISEQKVRKALIHEGAFESEMSNIIMDLNKRGKTVEEIMSILSVSRTTVHAYMPYSKTEYNSNAPSENAIRIRQCRERKLKK